MISINSQKADAASKDEMPDTREKEGAVEDPFEVKPKNRTTITLTANQYFFQPEILLILSPGLGSVRILKEMTIPLYVYDVGQRQVSPPSLVQRSSHNFDANPFCSFI